MFSIRLGREGNQRQVACEDFRRWAACSRPFPTLRSSCSAACVSDAPAGTRQCGQTAGPAASGESAVQCRDCKGVKTHLVVVLMWAIEFNLLLNFI